MGRVMEESLWERFKQWVCETFGHKLEGKAWVFEDQKHDNCLRCMRVISKPVYGARVVEEKK